MASRNLNDAHPILIEQFTKAKAAFEKQFPQANVFLTATYRSNEEQNALYEQGRTKPGPKVSNARAGQSSHNFKPSYAIDVAFTVNGKLDWSTTWFKLFAKHMQHPQIEWGGTWKFTDMPHFEIRGWKELSKKK